MKMESDVPPVENSPQNILNVLNDDCIKSIFLQITNLSDFLSAAEVCTRFQRNAQDCFKQKFKEVYIRDEFWDKNSIEPNRAKSVLRNFGHLIQSLKFIDIYKHRLKQNRYILPMISTFCGKTLKKFVFYGNKLDFDHLSSFTALEHLEFNKSEFEGPSDRRSILDLVYHSLGYLNQRGYSGDTNEILLRLKSFSFFKINPIDWLIRKCPKLETATFNSLDNLTNGMLMHFLMLNPNLKRLEVINCRKITSAFFVNIENNVPKLEHLKYKVWCYEYDSETFNENIFYATKLKYLKTFHISRNRMDLIRLNALVDAFVKNNVLIEDFKICWREMEPIKNLSKLTSLKKINSSSLSDEILIKCAQEITGLEELVAYQSENVSLWGIKKALEYGKKLSLLAIVTADTHIDIDTYNSILDLAKGRVKVIIGISNSSTDVPKDILESNNKWLTLHDDEYANAFNFNVTLYDYFNNFD